MNDKKDYTEEILPDGTIYRYYKSGKAFLRYRTKRSLDFAEKELERSFCVIDDDIDRFKLAAKNIKTKDDKRKLLLQLDSSLVRINSLLENEPLLKEYVSDIKIDGKLLREFGYSSDTIEIMRGRAKMMLETFQKELLKLKDEVMSIDFSGYEAPQIEEEINVPAGLLEFFLGPDNNNNDDKKDYKDEKEYKERNAKEFLKECKGKSAKSIARSYKTRSGKGLVKNYEQYRVKKLLYDELVNLRLISDIKPATFRTYFYK